MSRNETAFIGPHPDEPDWLTLSQEEQEFNERIEAEHEAEFHYDESTNPSNGWRSPR